MKNERKNEMKNIKVIHEFSQVKRCEIKKMELGADENLEPAMIIDTEEAEYHFPLTHGYYVANCNEFLRSFGTPAVVEFKSYEQYAKVIHYVMFSLFSRALLSEEGLLKEVLTEVFRNVDCLELKADEVL